MKQCIQYTCDVCACVRVCGRAGGRAGRRAGGRVHACMRPLQLSVDMISMGHVLILRGFFHTNFLYNSSRY